MQVLEEFDREQFDGFGAAGKDVMDDVVKSRESNACVELVCIYPLHLGDQFVDIGHCVGDDGVVWWHIEVGGCVFFDYGVDF